MFSTESVLRLIRIYPSLVWRENMCIIDNGEASGWSGLVAQGGEGEGGGHMVEFTHSISEDERKRKNVKLEGHLDSSLARFHVNFIKNERRFQIVFIKKPLPTSLSTWKMKWSIFGRVSLPAGLTFVPRRPSRRRAIEGELSLKSGSCSPTLCLSV